MDYKTIVAATAISLVLVSLSVADRFVLGQQATLPPLITNPSVPEFTLRFVDNSYDVPPIYEINPYSGQNITTEPGYHVQNRSIEVSVKNQRFISFQGANQSLVELYYNIRVKGHFGDWLGEPGSDSYIHRSDSQYTVVTYGLGGNNGSQYFGRRLDELVTDGQADFQVKAIIGYYTTIYESPSPYDWLFGGDGTPAHHDVFTGWESDWSNTQTITIATPSSTHTFSPSPSPIETPSPQPTTTPAQTPSPPQLVENIPSTILLVLGIVAIAISIATLGIVLYSRKHRE